MAHSQSCKAELSNVIISQRRNNTFRRLGLHGFTLIELLVVISIIALLVSILMPALSKARAQAKMVVCASNIHQTVIGVTTYSLDNDDRLPPCIASRVDLAPDVWGDPSLLCTNYGNPAGYEGVNGASVGLFLRDYLPLFGSFGCPLSSPEPDDIVPGYTQTYQQLYEDPDSGLSYGNDVTISSSYFLLWNYPGWKNNAERPSKPFIGPGKNSKYQLLVSDKVCSGFPGSRYFPLSFLSTHPTGEMVKNHIDIVEDRFSTDIFYGMTYYPGDPMPEIQMNAGYVDGHVERFNTIDAVPMSPGYGNFIYYLPSSF